MHLLYKQITKELLKDRFFVGLMFMLVFFTSFMYFFVHFSIDGNMHTLNALSSLGEHELLYQNALISNTILARNMLIVSILLTGFVYFMFFHRFFKKNSKQLGCLKSLGFKDNALRNYFIAFSAIVSILGGLLGLGIGYFATDILQQASMRSYQVTNLIKSVTISSVIIGILLPTVIFCFITFLTYFLIDGKEIALLLSTRSDASSYPILLHMAHKLANLCPTQNKLPMRLALRKPIALLLILIAVTSFSVMFILAYSLNLSSQKVYESQTLGHHYLFDTHFDTPKYLEKALPDTMPYLATLGTLETSAVTIEQQVIGFANNSSLFELTDAKGNVIPTPTLGEIVINPALRDLYDIKQGDVITLCIGNSRQNFTVSHIAFNATLNSIYITPSDLENLLSLPAHSYTGLWSMENHFNEFTVITDQQKMTDLERNFVSNRMSAVINQVIGCLIGCILLFLALLLNFQDNTKDILIMNLMGYRLNAIRKILVDLYKPIIWIFFLLTLWPSIQIVKTILRSLSIQIGDYMPFQTNIFVIAGIFALLNIVYILVQFTFNLGIKKIIKTNKLYEYTRND
jgi:putative ABC transport system permease protein